MKKIFIALFIFAIPTVTSAASLQNRDSSSYDIRVKSSSSTSSSSINGGTVKSSICSSCEIEVKGVGTVSISGSDKAVIKNGDISVR